MRTLLLLVTLGLAVCGDPQPFEPEIEVPLGETFGLHVDQSAEVSGTPLRLRFAAVREDSRCPTDVACVWAGNARVRVDAAASDLAEPLDLNTGLDPREVEFAGYRIGLEALQPEPRSATAIRTEDYVAVLRVTRDP